MRALWRSLTWTRHTVQRDWDHPTTAVHELIEECGNGRQDYSRGPAASRAYGRVIVKVSVV